MSDLIRRQTIKDVMMEEADEYCKDVSDLEYRKFLFVFVANLTDRFNLLSPVIPEEPCEDCISRRAAIEYFMTNTNWHDEDGDEIDDADEKRKLLEDYFSGVPSVTPAREKGKWIWDKRTGEYECSECGCNPIYEGIAFDYSEIDKYRYCRWCGAEMEVEE